MPKISFVAKHLQRKYSLGVDFENLRHPKRVWTYDFKGAVERISFRNNVLYLYI